MNEVRSKEVPVVTSEGFGIIESVVISDLEHLMVRIRYEDKWINHSIGKLEDFLTLKGISIQSNEEVEVI